MSLPKIRGTSVPNTHKGNKENVTTLNNAAKLLNALGERLNALRCSERSSDVGLFCHLDNAAVPTIVNCHESQLASISAYLKSLFEEFKRNQPGTRISITLENFDGILVEKLMQIVYTGESDLEDEGQAEDLRILAETLQLDINLEVDQAETLQLYIDLEEGQVDEDEEDELQIGQEREKEKSDDKVGINEKGDDVTNEKGDDDTTQIVQEIEQEKSDEIDINENGDDVTQNGQETVKEKRGDEVDIDEEGDDFKQIVKESEKERSGDEVDINEEGDYITQNDQESEKIDEVDINEKGDDVTLSVKNKLNAQCQLSKQNKADHDGKVVPSSNGSETEHVANDSSSSTDVVYDSEAPRQESKLKEKARKSLLFGSTTASAASSLSGKRLFSEMDKCDTVSNKEPKKMRAEEDSSDEGDRDLREKRRQEVSVGLVKPGEKAEVETKRQKPGPKSRVKTHLKEMPQEENDEQGLEDAKKASKEHRDDEAGEIKVANKIDLFTTEDVFYCDLCGAIFLTSMAIKQHMKNEHPDNSDSDSESGDEVDDEELPKSQNSLSSVSESSVSTKKAMSKLEKPLSESSKKSAVDTPQKPSLEPFSSSVSKKKSPVKIREELMREQSKGGSPVCDSDMSDSEIKEPPMEKKIAKNNYSVQKKGLDPSKATPKRRQRLSSSLSSSDDEEHTIPKGSKFHIRLSNPAFILKTPSSKSSNSATKSGSPTHSSKREIECLLCSYRATNQSGIRNHVVNHYKDKLQRDLPPIKPFNCPIASCNQVSRDKTTLLRHYAFKHRKILEYCDEKHLKGKLLCVDDDNNVNLSKSNGKNKSGKKYNTKSLASVQADDDKNDSEQNDKQTKKDDRDESDEEEQKKTKEESEDNAKKSCNNNTLHSSDSSDDSLDSSDDSRSLKSSAIASNASNTFFSDLLNRYKDEDKNEKKEENNRNNSENDNDPSQEND